MNKLDEQGAQKMNLSAMGAAGQGSIQTAMAPPPTPSILAERVAELENRMTAAEEYAGRLNVTLSKVVNVLIEHRVHLGLQPFADDWYTTP
jgi:hypothetical protein